MYFPTRPMERIFCKTNPPPLTPLRPPPPKLSVSSVGQYGNFLKIHINNFFLRLYVFCWALMCWLFCSSIFCVICECYRILYGGWANSWASASKLCTSQFQTFPSIPPSPNPIYPGNLTGVKLHTVGNLTENEVPPACKMWAFWNKQFYGNEQSSIRQLLRLSVVFSRIFTFE